MRKRRATMMLVVAASLTSCGLLGKIAPAADDVVRTAAQKVESLQRGNADEKLVAAAACSVMRSGFGTSQTNEETKADLYSQLGSTVPRAAIDPTVDRIADSLTIIRENPGIARNYITYCKI